MVEWSAKHRIGEFPINRASSSDLNAMDTRVSRCLKTIEGG